MSKVRVQEDISHKPPQLNGVLGGKDQQLEEFIPVCYKQSDLEIEFIKSINVGHGM